MPKAAKVGDQVTDHDGFHPTAISAGSPDVFIDNQPAARVGDPTPPHSKPNHPPHGRTIAVGNPNILVNGLPLAETGSAVSCGGVVVGSGTVSTGYDNGVSMGPGVSIGGGVTMNGKNELCEVVNGEARALSLIEILELTKQEWLQIIEPVRQALVNKGMAPPHAYQPPQQETTQVASSQPRHLVNPFDTNGGGAVSHAPDYDNIDPSLPLTGAAQGPDLKIEGFDNNRYNQHDALIVELVDEFNADKPGMVGATQQHLTDMEDLDPRLVKSWMIQESGGSRRIDIESWEVDPMQVNVHLQDWNEWKPSLGLNVADIRNKGDLRVNMRAAIIMLARKGYGRSTQPPVFIDNRPNPIFDGWKVSLERYNGRTSNTQNGQQYKVNYANRIWDRAYTGVHHRIELPRSI